MEALKRYYTSKYIYVNKPWLSYLNKTLQFLILMYVIFFNIVYKGGYQTSDTFEGILMANLGSVTVKVKGVGIDSNTQYIDAYDLVRPAQETNALFIGTHRSIVNGQTMTTCTGMDDSISDTTTRNELCSEDKTCPKDVYTANGKTTGVCKINPYGDGKNYCEVYGWCPLENKAKESLIEDAANFTVFVRADGYFPNLLPKKRFSTYSDGKLIWNYNLFYVSDLVAAAMSPVENPLPDQVPVGRTPNRLSFDDFKKVMNSGAIIMVDILYDCNLDKSKNCKPHFKFTRVDTNDNSTSGFNFRETNYYHDGQSTSSNYVRDLKKYYGIKFIFNVHGEGRQYDFLALSITIGSGIGLLSIATYLCDIILTNCVKDKEYISKRKYECISSNDIQTALPLNLPMATLA